MSCEEGYGFLPCSSSVGGSLMLMLGYGYVLLKGAEYISDGSERLLEVLDPGLIGGLLLPVLGAVPDAAIIVVSGLGGSVEEAQDQVSVGMGTLAGSTIMLLTLAWGGSVQQINGSWHMWAVVLVNHCGIASYLRSRHTSGVGEPRTSKMSAIWLASVLPGMSGLPRSNSARMQPALHISTGQPYCLVPSKSSGGRYHNVITLFVNSPCSCLSPPWSRKLRAKPKSASLTT